MGTFSPESGLPLFSVGYSSLSRRQPQEPNTRWGQGMSDADGPTLVPGSWLGERGLGCGPQNPSEASGAQALAGQFCKSTTFLAKIPAMSPWDLATEVRPSGGMTREGSLKTIFKKWFGPAWYCYGGGKSSPFGAQPPTWGPANFSSIPGQSLIHYESLGKPLPLSEPEPGKMS